MSHSFDRSEREKIFSIFIYTFVFLRVVRPKYTNTIYFAFIFWGRRIIEFFLSYFVFYLKLYFSWTRPKDLVRKQGKNRQSQLLFQLEFWLEFIKNSMSIYFWKEKLRKLNHSSLSISQQKSLRIPVWKIDGSRIVQEFHS